MSENNIEALLSQGAELTKNKEYSKALEVYEKILNLDENNLEAIKHAGINSFLTNEPDKALGYFQKFVTLNEDDATVRYYLGSIYTLNNEYEKAIEEFKKVISLREEYLDAYRSLAMIYMANQNNNAAIEVLKVALSFDDSDAQTIKLLATAYLNNKENESSEELLKNAVAKGIENTDIHNMLGSSYVIKEEHQKALQHFEKALEFNDEDYTATISCALLYGIMLDFEKALEYHKKALDIFPQNYELQINAAIDWYVNGYLNESKQLMEEILLIEPNEVRAIYQIALIYYEMYDYEKALDKLYVAEKIATKPDVINLKIAEVYADIGRYEEAFEIMEQLIRKNPTEADYYYKYAIISTKAKDSINAEKYFKKVISLKGDDANARKDLGVLYLSINQMDYAKEEFKKAYELAPKDPWIIFEYGNCFFLEGNYQQALYMYNKAISINPDAIEYHISKAILMNKLKNFDETIKILKPIVEHKNKHHQVLYTLACAYMQKDDLIEAKQIIENYLADGRTNIEILNLYTIILSKLGEYEEALKIIDMMLEQNPNNLSLMISKAAFLGQKGDITKAEDTYLTVLSVLPEYEDAIVELLNLYKENGLIAKAKDFVKKIDKELFSETVKELIQSFE